MYGYTGEPTDPLNGLVYLRARHLSPRLGVFPSRDRFEGVMGRPLSLNPYAWVEGNVVNATDPSGWVMAFRDRLTFVESTFPTFPAFPYDIPQTPTPVTITQNDSNQHLIDFYEIDQEKLSIDRRWRSPRKQGLFNKHLTPKGYYSTPFGGGGGRVGGSTAIFPSGGGFFRFGGSSNELSGGVVRYGSWAAKINTDAVRAAIGQLVGIVVGLQGREETASPSIGGKMPEGTMDWETAEVPNRTILDIIRAAVNNFARADSVVYPTYPTEAERGECGEEGSAEWVTIHEQRKNTQHLFCKVLEACDDTVKRRFRNNPQGLHAELVRRRTKFLDCANARGNVQRCYQQDDLGHRKAFDNAIKGAEKCDKAIDSLEEQENQK